MADSAHDVELSPINEDKSAPANEVKEKKEVKEAKETQEVTEQSARKGPCFASMRLLFGSERRARLMPVATPSAVTGRLHGAVKFNNRKYGGVAGAIANIEVAGDGVWHFEVKTMHPCNGDMMFGFGTPKLVSAQFLHQEAIVFGVLDGKFVYSSLGDTVATTVELHRPFGHSDRFSDGEIIGFTLFAKTNEVHVQLIGKEIVIPCDPKYKGIGLSPVALLDDYQQAILMFNPGLWIHHQPSDPLTHPNLVYTDREIKRLLLTKDEELAPNQQETKHHYVQLMLSSVFDFVDEDRTGTLDREELDVLLHFLLQPREKFEWEDTEKFSKLQSLHSLDPEEFKKWTEALHDELTTIGESEEKQETATAQGAYSVAKTKAKEARFYSKKSWIDLYYSTIPTLGKFSGSKDGVSSQDPSSKVPRRSSFFMPNGVKPKKAPTGVATPDSNDEKTLIEALERLGKEALDNSGRRNNEEQPIEHPLIRLHFFMNRIYRKLREESESRDCICVDCCFACCAGCCGDFWSSLRMLRNRMSDTIVNFTYVLLMPLFLVIFTARDWRYQLPPNEFWCRVVGMLVPLLLLCAVIYYIAFINVIVYYQQYEAEQSYPYASFLEVWMPVYLFGIFSILVSNYLTERQRLSRQRDLWKQGGDISHERERLFKSSLSVKTMKIFHFESEHSFRRSLDDILVDLHPRVLNRDCWRGFMLWGLPAIFGVIVSLVPGVYRVAILHDPFFGEADAEKAVCVLYIILTLPSAYGLCVWLEFQVTEFKHLVVQSFKNIAAFTNARDARSEKLSYYIDLAVEFNIPRWLLVRQAMQQRVAHVVTRSQKNLSPIILLIVMLAVVIFVRVFILLTPKEFDIFNVLAAVFIVILTFYVARVLLAMAESNSALLNTHLMILKKRQYALARQMEEAPTLEDQTRRANTLRLLEKAEYNVTNFDSSPVRIWGQAITQAQVNRLISLATAAILSALSKLVGIILQRRGRA